MGRIDRRKFQSGSNDGIYFYTVGESCFSAIPTFSIYVCKNHETVSYKELNVRKDIYVFYLQLQITKCLRQQWINSYNTVAQQVRDSRARSGPSPSPA